MRISDWSSDVCSSDLIFHDNLLDASHLSYVHLGSLDNGGIAAAKYKIEEEGQSIFLRREEPGVCYEEPLASFFGCKPGLTYNREIGRASCRERVCRYVSITVVAVSLKKKKKKLEN